MVSTMCRVLRVGAAFFRPCVPWVLLCASLVLGMSPPSLAATAIYSYNSYDQLVQISYSDGTVIQYAYDSNGNRLGATIVTLATPTGLTATEVSDTQINLSWGASAQATSYAVQRCEGAGCTSFVQDGSATSGTTFQDTGLTPGTTYVYRVQGLDTSNNTSSAFSNTASATTATDTTPPTVPTGLQATAANYSTVNLSWTASTDPVGVAGYKIYRNGTQVGTTSGTSYTDSSLSPSTNYSYTVSAYDTVGNVSAQCSAVSVTTPAIPLPSVPTGLTASAAGNTQINLSWSASSDSGGPGIAGYKVYRNGSQIGTTTATSYSDTGVAVFNTYSYTVAAYDVDGNTSAQSSAASGSTFYTITNSSGTVLSSASSSYSVTSRFEAGPMGASDGFYVWYVTETVGSKVTAVNVNGPTGGTSPACADGTTTSIASGYELSGCVLTAEPSVYGH